MSRTKELAAIGRRWRSVGREDPRRLTFRIQRSGDQAQEFRRGSLVGEVPACFERAPVAGIGALDCVGGADDAADPGHALGKE